MYKLHFSLKGSPLSVQDAMLLKKETTKHFRFTSVQLYNIFYSEQYIICFMFLTESLVIIITYNVMIITISKKWTYFSGLRSFKKTSKQFLRLLTFHTPASITKAFCSIYWILVLLNLQPYWALSF